MRLYRRPVIVALDRPVRSLLILEPDVAWGVAAGRYPFLAEIQRETGCDVLIVNASPSWAGDMMVTVALDRLHAALVDAGTPLDRMFATRRADWVRRGQATAEWLERWGKDAVGVFGSRVVLVGEDLEPYAGMMAYACPISKAVEKPETFYLRALGVLVDDLTAQQARWMVEEQFSADLAAGSLRLPPDMSNRVNSDCSPLSREALRAGLEAIRKQDDPAFDAAMDAARQNYDDYLEDRAVRLI